MNQIAVLLVEDHTVVREGFRRMLELESDMKVVGEAKDGRQGVAMTRSLRPDVILMDIAMPLLNGLEATRQVTKAFPGARVLILSAHNDDAYVESAVAAGAAGFLLKQTSSHEVCQAIREVHRGKSFFTGSLGRRRSDAQGRPVLGRREVQLTSREVEVLQLIAEGKPNKATASELRISIKTVEKHREHLMSKLDIHDTAGLTRYAIGAGIIESRVQLTTL